MKTKRKLFGICLLGMALLQPFTCSAQPITRIAAGGFQTMFLKDDGSLWAMGANFAGQLGDGTSDNGNYSTNRPELIVANNVTGISGSDSFSLFLKSDGSLWAMGDNQHGIPLSGGTFISTNVPQQIVSDSVTAVAAGQNHCLILKSNGSLWAVGYNYAGQLGDGTFNHTNLPEMIVASNVTAVAAGGYHSLFLKSDGSLWGMGFNHTGELGDGTINGTNRPEMIVDSNVTAIAAGLYHSLFLKSDGSLWAMGYNYNGQLGDGTTNISTNLPEMIVPSNVTAIAAGYNEFSLFLKSDGSLWGMGRTDNGQLGDGTTNNFNNLPEMIVPGNVKAIAAGCFHSLFLKSDGSLWGTGGNGYGELGDGVVYQTNRPTQILGAYNQINCQPLIGGNMRLSYMGIAGANYALDRSASLAPPNWLPQATNPANSFGALVLTNTPNPAANNFWRIRSAP